MTAALAMHPVTQERGVLGSKGSIGYIFLINLLTLLGGGHLLPGIQARVIKADGTLARYGEPGELLVKGDSMALGYFNDENAYVLLPFRRAEPEPEERLIIKDTRNFQRRVSFIPT